MQSGISASPELDEAFSSFTSDSSLFALPVTIQSESLQPLDPVAFPKSSADFLSSLPSLSPRLGSQTPIYLLLRKSQQSKDLVAVTYIPSTSPVRSKTLFASTRSTLLRELGLGKFSESIFCTEASEILDPKEWEDREGGDGGYRRSSVDPDVLTAEERELQSVKRAEDEERRGTQRRDVMGTNEGVDKAGGGSSSGITMNVEDGPKGALWTLGQEEGGEIGRVVQLGIDIPTETLTLGFASSNVSPADLSSRIPHSKPSYTFYRYPSTTAIAFIYCCPPSSKIKERMLYASCRASVLEIARGQQVEVVKKLETAGPEEITEELLNQAVGSTSGGQGSSGRQAFARPKRPGKR